MKVWSLSTGMCELDILADTDTDESVYSLFLLKQGTIAATYTPVFYFIKIWDLKSAEDSICGNDNQEAGIHQPATTMSEEVDIFSRCLRGHCGGIIALAQLANGNLVSGGHDSTIRLWDLTMDPTLYCCVRVLFCVNRVVSFVRVMGDGETIVCDSGRNWKLLFWDTTTGAAFCPVSGAVKGISGIEVLPDGVTVATSNDYGKIMLWNYQHMLQ
jgi:WD40 repeat protein